VDRTIERLRSAGDHYHASLRLRCGRACPVAT
jgi:hypothetical protein